jgi:hypothetical protein
VLDHGKNLFT